MSEIWKVVLTVFCAAIGAYIGSYLKRKGENLATREDIDALVEQVSAVTTATKEIEAKISNEVWDKQKRWELKREVLFETLKDIAMVKERLTALYLAFQKSEAQKDNSEKIEKLMQANKSWDEAADNLEKAAFLIALSCEDELKQLVQNFNLFNRNFGAKIFEGQSKEEFLTSMKDFTSVSNAIVTTMRKEMGIRKPA